jgi:hypothetical protein
MRKRISVIFAGALTSLALLVPAGSAQAANVAQQHWCNNGSVGYVVQSGKTCTWWPVNANTVLTGWNVIGPGSGSVCVAILKYPWPNGQMQPLDDFGQPTSWSCNTLRHDGNPSSTWHSAGRFVYQGFGGVYGQPALLNFSSAKIQILVDQLNYVRYFY